ncbi:restriction endonuclease subunit S [Amedibacillus hominis]|uniref:Restriction endonuclease subunit S n=1 Tax=Amedibacillus hominis TaxID=2897776 RepID=A0ABS9R9D0_9FIRM|nr:restriction endonuclease subunit S [Amedibacillus hominis]MCH4286272.1 restriction endonuclease subunit S [Amedibacillus hominis]
MEESKKPALRFKGFHDDWEQRKLGEIADYKKGPFGSALKKEIFIPKSENSVKVYEQQNAIGKNWKLERYFITKEYANELKAFETHGGDILVSCAGTIGEMYELPDNSEVGVINQALMRVRVNEKIISKELYKLLFTNMIDDFSKEHSNGSAMKNIPPFADLKAMNVMLPTLDEQERIGAYFNKLDHLITLHQRKYESLVNIKKAMLEKMFPKNEEVVPELRFAGFTDTWEQRKFNVSFDFLQNNALSRAELSNDGEVMNVHYGDILVKYGEVLDIAQEELTYLQDSSIMKKYQTSLLRNGDVIIADAAEDETVGKCSEIAGLSIETVLSGLHTIPCRPAIKFAEGYLGYYMNSDAYHDQLLPLIQGTKISSISKSAIQDTEIVYPKSEKEQTAISTYFKHLDNLITLHQRELEKLQNIKKSCLEKMFI